MSLVTIPTPQTLGGLVMQAQQKAGRSAMFEGRSSEREQAEGQARGPIFLLP